MDRFLKWVMGAGLVLWVVITALIVGGRAVGQALYSDVQMLAFVSEDYNHSIIYLVDVNGCQKHRLAESERTAWRYSGLVWSPDGRWLTFELGGEWDSEIYIMDVYSGETHNLTAHPGGDRGASWSPDGRRIAFTSRRNDGLETYILDVATGETHNLNAYTAVERCPAWSPDGRWIAFLAQFDEDVGLEVHVQDVNSGDIYNVSNSPYYDEPAQWSPDGCCLVFASIDSEFKSDIYMVDLTSGERRNLTHSPEHERMPAISPDGHWLSYAIGDEYENFFIAVMDLETGERYRLLSYLADSIASSRLYHAWSPNNRWLAFSANMDQRTPTREIHIVDIHTGEVRNVSNTPENDFWPAWMP